MPADPSDVGLDLTVPLPESGVAALAAGRVRGRPALDSQGGSRVDHFVVERKIGSGGMGAIYAARDTALDRPVAVKILPDELAREPGARERFIREAQAQARLSSPHVVQIFFIGQLPPEMARGEPPADGSPYRAEPERGSLYFAMELIDGESLEAPLLRGEKLDPEAVRKLMIQAAKGLDDAYRAGIIHRDVKPGNLLADRAGNLKIADFGLAKPSDPNLSLTREGAVLGTPYYMAPEQSLGETLDQRADMYALGCSFYHLLAGEPPFDGSSPMAVMAKHLKNTARPIREACPAIPLPLATVIERLMEKEQAKRYASYAELIEALEAAAPTRIERAGFWTRAAAAMLDGVVAGVLIRAIGWPGLVVYIAYMTGAQAYVGQTAAKYVLRIRVERQDGTRLGLGRSFVRMLAATWLPCWIGFFILRTEGFAELKDKVLKLSNPGEAEQLIGALVLGNLVLAAVYAAGMLMAALDPQKRAAHDLLVGSRVVYQLGSHKLALLPAAKAG